MTLVCSCGAKGFPYYGGLCEDCWIDSRKSLTTSIPSDSTYDGQVSAVSSAFFEKCERVYDGPERV